MGKQIQETKRPSTTAFHKQALHTIGVRVSVPTMSRVVAAVRQTAQQQVVQSFQALPAVLDFLEEQLDAHVAFEAHAPDDDGTEHFQRAVIILPQCQVRVR
jgi:hypothetical protein